MSQKKLPLQNWFQQPTNIRAKISLGYMIAIGIAVLGATSGQIIGKNYIQRASHQQEMARQKNYLLSNLSLAVLSTRIQQQQFTSLVVNPPRFREANQKFKVRIAVSKRLLDEVRSFASHYPEEDQEILDIERWLKTHKNTIDFYEVQVNANLQQLQQINIDDLNPEKLIAARTLLLTLTNSEPALKLDQLSHSLGELIQICRENEAEARLQMQEAEKLQNFIINGSLLLSAAFAIALAIYISRTIAHPLEAVTHKIQTATEESDFDVEVPVLTQDEIGVLAHSFNQLITRISEYTQALELSRETLEKRVEERTQELSQALADLQKMQSQMIQAEKMSSLGQMVAGVAHEINNPVNFIYGNIAHVKRYTEDLLKIVNLYHQYYPDSHASIQAAQEEMDLEFVLGDMPKLLDSMKMGAERIRQIVLSLRNFARLDESELKWVDLHEGLDSTLLILSHRIKKEITISKNYENLPLVECYSAQINQVFMNILSNAIDALQDYGKQTEKQILIQTKMIDSDQVRIEIQDNGPGIPLEIQHKLFDPFFTTKPIGKGTGLGLSICYQIIYKHQGSIAVSSEMGTGATFVIYLPIRALVRNSKISLPLSQLAAV